MAPRKDHYRVMGIAPTSSRDEIHKAYRALSKEWHPDANLDSKEMANERMQELVTAYNVLKDVQTRKEYDNQSHFKIRRDEVSGRKFRGKGKAKAPSFLDRLGAMMSPKGKRLAPQDGRKKSQEHFDMGLSMVDNPSFLNGAKNEFKLSTTMDPDYRDAHYNLGIVCYRLGEFDEAINCLQRVLTLDRNDKDAKTLIQLLRNYEY